MTKSFFIRIARGDIERLTHCDSTHFTQVNLYKILTSEFFSFIIDELYSITSRHLN